MNTPHQSPTWLACLFIFSLIAGAAFGRAPDLPEKEAAPGAAIGHDLEAFGKCATVLYVAAHPDDENTQLITYFSQGRGFRTAYLSVTRGDGGQNVLGPEFGDELGVIRTQELLEARKVDGGRQFFTRAIDFGFSKDPNETLSIWDRKAVLGDMVRVIREFRPDVIITRFSPEPSRTHGHHTASAMLTVEAFKLAGDPSAYPEQLGELKPWQPKRILHNGRSGGGESPVGAFSIDISGADAVTGHSFDEIAAKSRSMHQSQGFAGFTGFGSRGAAGARMETFLPLGGEPAAKDPFDGIDTTWARYPGGEGVAKSVADAIAGFRADDPAASIPALLAIRSKAAALPSDPVIADKREQLDRIIAECAGIRVRTEIANPEVCPGETMALQVSAAASAPVRWVAVRFPATDRDEVVNADLSSTFTRRSLSAELPPTAPLTQPYWLRETASAGIAQVSDAMLIGRAENPPVFPVEYVFEIAGQGLVVRDVPAKAISAGDGAISREELVVVPPVSLSFKSDIRLFAPGEQRAVEVEVLAARPQISGTVSLEVPAGWSVSPAPLPLKLVQAGDRKAYEFQVTAPGASAPVDFGVRAEVAGREYGTRRIDIRYPHIPRQVLQPPARLRAVCLDLKTAGHRIGYVPGAGDSVAECLEQMGFEVTTLTGEDLTPEKLKGLDAVVIGVRAFNVRNDLSAGLPALFAFAEAGGTVVVQYNRPNGIQSGAVAPFNLQISSDRVTDENAPVTLLAPEHSVLNTPNKILAKDFEGWVQERGLYFPNQWDERFVPLIACSDPGEAPLKGGLLVAPYGKGRYIYTGLAWFRELPAGVPGAYRLFANLVAPSE
ncbi:MAG: PIG-L family deacetylase [Phycisphaeraceae bacterium]|nr:PIG-L family deacetylase [Phycisphaeraceae bacterium]